MEHNTTNKQKKELINNILDYYFNDSINKYDTINLIIATLNNKIDTNKNINDNLEQIKK